MKTSDVFSRPYFFAFALSLILSAPLGALAQYEDDEAELMDYDSIVRELTNTGTNRAQTKALPSDPFASIMLHGGIGLASTFGSVTHQGSRINMDQRGFQAALGIDLFSETWLAEGTARSFTSINYGRYGVGLKEFDLKLYYRNRMTSNVGLRVGTGLAARYLTISAPNSAEVVYTTPSSIFALGAEYYVGRAVSIGAELSARNSLISETVDKSSIDATVRLDTHF